MFRKTACLVVAMATLAGLVVACEGPAFKNGEGDSCNGNDSCSDGLVCQPIGDAGEYCCPTPATASSKSTCKGGNEGNGS